MNNFYRNKLLSCFAEFSVYVNMKYLFYHIQHLVYLTIANRGNKIRKDIIINFKLAAIKLHFYRIAFY